MYCRDVSTGADCSLEVLHLSLDVSDGKYVGSDADEESELLWAEADAGHSGMGGSRTRPLRWHGCRRPIFICGVHINDPSFFILGRPMSKLFERACDTTK